VFREAGQKSAVSRLNCIPVGHDIVKLEDRPARGSREPRLVEDLTRGLPDRARQVVRRVDEQAKREYVKADRGSGSLDP